MKTSHHFLAVLLAVLLCLSLTACGDSSDDVTGDDWRVSGVVAAEGTIRVSTGSPGREYAPAVADPPATAMSPASKSATRAPTESRRNTPRIRFM